MKKIAILFLFISTLGHAYSIPNETDFWLDRYKLGVITYLPDKIGNNCLYYNDFGMPYYASYYVDGNVGTTGTGTIGSPYKTIQEAITQAQPGDIVYVKAADYGSSILTTTRAGTSGNLIRFIGYTSTPEDIDSSTYATYTRAQYDADSRVLPNNIMPLLNNDRGGDNAPETSDRAWNLDHSYIHIENFMIQYYQYGVQDDVGVTGLHIENIVCNEMGNWDPTNAGWDKTFSNPPPSGNLSGYGFHFVGTSNSTLLRTITFDAGHAGIDFINADNNSIDYNIVHCTRTGNATDYHLIVYNSDNNQLNGNKFYRDNLDNTKMHPSRTAIQCGSVNNTINDLYQLNLRLQLFNGASNNTLTDIRLEGSGDPNQGSIAFSGAANDNTIINLHVTDSQGIDFYTNAGGQCGYTGNEPSGSGNVIINPLITDIWGSEGFVTFNEQATSNGANAGSNTIIGGVFDRSSYMFQVRRQNTLLQMVNCSFNNVTVGYEFEPDGAIAMTYDYDYCNFFNTNFTTPTGTSITTVNPLFVDSTNGDYTLQSGSPLIGSGVNATSFSSDSNVDFDGNSRPAGAWTIGIYEPNAAPPVTGGIIKKKNSLFGVMN